MFLTDKEVRRLTRRKRPNAQARVLFDSGIDYQMVDGRPVVRRSQFEQTATPPEPELRLVR